MQIWGEKPYHSLDYELKQRFGEKVYKLTLNGGMSCPNRDGKISFGGCIFCSEGGSGEFASSAMLSIPEQIQDAKKDRTNLNKLQTVLNDERKRMEKEYLAPFDVFKAQVNEIISIIEKPKAVIDKQVKAYEEKQKQEKKAKIEAYWYEILQADKVPEAVKFEQIFNEKWLNASVSMKSIQGEIDARLEQIANDMATLRNLPEFGFEAMEVYKSTLDLNRALNEGRRLSEIAKAKAAHEAEMKARAEEQARLEAEAKKVLDEVKIAEDMNSPEEPAMGGVIKKPVEYVPEQGEVIMPLKQWVRFQACMTTSEALELKKFFDERNIDFRPI
jgi:hypothetical protein